MCRFLEGWGWGSKMGIVYLKYALGCVSVVPRRTVLQRRKKDKIQNYNTP